jgi:hypothetical protein
MTRVDLIEQVISKVHITEDKDILEFVLQFLNQNEIPEPYHFTGEQKRRLDISISESVSGQLISEEEDEKMTNEWLGK